MKKVYIFVMIFIFCLFLNVDKVTAANSCTCYYAGTLTTEDNGSDYKTNYLVSIDVNKSDFDKVENKSEYEPNISFFGEKGYNVVTSESGKIEDKTSSAEWFSRWWQKGAGLDGNRINSLFDNDCSCQNLGTLTFVSQNNSKELLYNIDDYYYLFGNDIPILDFERVDFYLITKSQFEEQRKSDNVADTYYEQGYTDEEGIKVDTQTIVDWASNQGYEVNSIGDPCSIISPKLQSLLNTIFWAISIIGIILVVVMTALGFIKAIVGSDDEKFRDAFRHLLTRIIVVIILLLLPAILSFIITLINDSSTGEVTVGKDGNVFCDIAN